MYMYTHTHTQKHIKKIEKYEKKKKVDSLYKRMCL